MKVSFTSLNRLILFNFPLILISDNIIGVCGGSVFVSNHVPFTKLKTHHSIFFHNVLSAIGWKYE